MSSFCILIGTYSDTGTQPWEDTIPSMHHRTTGIWCRTSQGRKNCKPQIKIKKVNVLDMWLMVFDILIIYIGKLGLLRLSRISIIWNQIGNSVDFGDSSIINM